MPDYRRITVFILTPLIFRYHLPLRKAKFVAENPSFLSLERI
jgi:hypothetical protein